MLFSCSSPTSLPPCLPGSQAASLVPKPSRLLLLWSLRTGNETPSWLRLSIPRRFVWCPVSPLWQQPTPFHLLFCSAISSLSPGTVACGKAEAFLPGSQRYNFEIRTHNFVQFHCVLLCYKKSHNSSLLLLLSFEENLWLFSAYARGLWLKLPCLHGAMRWGL